MELVFDIETNGFLEDLDKIHSLSIRDATSGAIVMSCSNSGGKDNIEDGLKILTGDDVDKIIGHNIIKFDLPAIQKVYPDFSYKEETVFDTLTATRLIWTDLLNQDMGKIRAGSTGLQPKMAGSHSLEAWGIRLGAWKGDYSKMMADKGLDPWLAWNQEMQDYCDQDTQVNLALYNLILGKNYSRRALNLEHYVAFAMADTERNGFAFNVKAGEDLYRDLSKKQAEMGDELRTIFEPWDVKDGQPFVPKRDNKAKGYVKNVPIQKYKTVVFNPNSRDHIADRLKNAYGWKPVDFTPSGKPKVDAAVLSKLNYPEAQRLSDYMMQQKVIGMLAEGKNAWLKLEKNGRIHGSIITNGAVTGRATHSHPNIGQVPSVTKPYGKECRQLFGVNQLGCDLSGLELRMLAHYLAAHDNGEYAELVIDGDVHTANQQAAGLDTRNQAKTFIYALLYGAGDAKLGEAANGGPRLGKRLRSQFLAKLPAFKQLSDGVQNAVKTKGKLTGLDGRDLHTRSPHSALNLLLQSAGAIVSKQWIHRFVRDLQLEGLYQTDVKIVAWVHDEIQMELNVDMPEEKRIHVGNLCVKAAIAAGEDFNLRCTLDAEFKIGNNWLDCH